MPGKPKAEEPSKNKAVTRVFLPRQVHLRKNLNIFLVSSAKGNMPCGSALCLRRKPQHNVQNSLRKTNCASPAYKGTTHSGNVIEQRNAPNQVAPAPIVYFSMVLNVFILVGTRQNDSHTRPNAGQTRTNAEPDKASTKADRKSFSKNILNASSNHADTNPVQLDVSCAISNDEFSIITSKGLLPIIKLQVSTDFQSADCLTLCDSASRQSWISAKLVKCLNLSGRDLDLTVNGINTKTVVKTKQVQMKVSSNFDGFEYIFQLTAFVKDDFKVGTDTFNIPALQSRYPYLAPIKAIVYSYADGDLIIGQDSFHVIRPEEYFKSEADPSTSPVVVCQHADIYWPNADIYWFSFHLIQVKYG